MIFNKYFYTLVWFFRYLTGSLKSSKFFSNIIVNGLPLSNYIKEHDVIYDVGSHAGSWAFELSKFNKKGNIFCFEAFPQYSYSLNILKTIFLKKNITVLNLAISDKDEFVNFRWKNEKGERLTGSSYVESKKKLYTKKFHIKVQANSLDQISKKLLNSCDNLKLIKLDIEGNEYKAIVGSKKIIEKYKPLIVLEIYKNNSSSKYDPNKKLLNLLYKLNYKPLAIHPKGLPHRYVVFPANKSLLKLQNEGDLIMIHKTVNLKKELKV